MKKIMIVADEPGWIFERHAIEIASRLGKWYKFDICFLGDHFHTLEKDYDLFYIMDPFPVKYPNPEKVVMGLRCQWLYEKNMAGIGGLYAERYKGKCKALHCVNRAQIKEFSKIDVREKICYAPHGVDTEIFKKIDLKKDGGLVVGFNGRRDSIGGKGFGLIESVCREIGVNYLSAEYGSGKRDKRQMVDFYESIDVFVNLSDSEGLNNSILEAGASGLPIIVTNVGAVPEIVVNGYNGIIIDKDRVQLKDAILSLDYDKRTRLGENLSSEIRSNWSWEKNISGYADFFDYGLEE